VVARYEELPLMKRSILTKFAAGASAAVLALGAVACGEDEIADIPLETDGGDEAELEDDTLGDDLDDDFGEGEDDGMNDDM
jgi:hypothetical protein